MRHQAVWLSVTFHSPFGHFASFWSFFSSIDGISWISFAFCHIFAQVLRTICNVCFFRCRERSILGGHAAAITHARWSINQGHDRNTHELSGIWKETWSEHEIEILASLWLCPWNVQPGGMLRVSNFTADETLIHTGASERKHLPGSLLPALLQSCTVGGFLSSQSGILSAFLWC